MKQWFRCSSGIVPLVQEYVNSVTSHKTSTETLIPAIPSTIRARLDKILYSEGLPKVHRIHIFVRSASSAQDLHIDYDGTTNDIIHCALNIPIRGCTDSVMTWLEGPHTAEKKTAMLKGRTITAMVPMFSGDVTTHNTCLDQPTMVRVDTPHFVKANTIETRVMASVRFEGNPTWEEILHHDTTSFSSNS